MKNSVRIHTQLVFESNVKDNAKINAQPRVINDNAILLNKNNCCFIIKANWKDLDCPLEFMPCAFVMLW